MEVGALTAGAPVLPSLGLAYPLRLVVVLLLLLLLLILVFLISHTDTRDGTEY
jgi:hypothetical protein